MGRQTTFDFMVYFILQLPILIYIRSHFVKSSEISEVEKVIASLRASYVDHSRHLDNLSRRLFEIEEYSFHKKINRPDQDNRKKYLHNSSILDSSSVIRSLPLNSRILSTIDQAITDHGITSQKHTLETHPKRNRISRNLQFEKNTTKCDGSLFRVDIHLDVDGSQTSWILMDDLNNDTIASKSYEESDHGETKSFETCLESGPYTFTLKDDTFGIRCNIASECYEMYLNNDLTIQGKWFSEEIKHSFQASTASANCPFGFSFVLNFSHDLEPPSVNWTLHNRALNQAIILEPLPSEDSLKSYFSCIAEGTYDFFLRNDDTLGNACVQNNSCNEIFINEQKYFEDHDFSAESGISFYVSRTGNIGKLKESLCAQLPVLSSANDFNNFVFDSATLQNLNVLFSLTTEDLLFDFSSPQYKAACWILLDDVITALDDDLFMIERYALAVTFFSLNQGYELLIPTQTCDFEKISCDETGLISKLRMSNGDLGGTLPKEISLLKNLESLSFSRSNIVGTIPTELGRLKKLKFIFFQGNQISGHMPSEIGRLIKLEGLMLQQNFLDGAIPSEIGLCQQLRRIDLTANYMSGTLPKTFYDLVQLDTIDLTKNKFQGTLSSAIGQLKMLRFLTLNFNSLSGQIPPEIGNLRRLDRLALSNNMLSGSLPVEIGLLTALSTIALSSNDLSGTVPDIFGNFSNLWDLDISNNKFSGMFPNSFLDLNMKDNLGPDTAFTKYAVENDLRANVTNKQCANVGINFLGATFPSLFVDDSLWFLNEPKVNCSCCSKGHCYMWSDTKSLIHGTTRPKCPTGNIHPLFSRYYYGGFDVVANEIHLDLTVSVGDTGDSLIVRNDMCLSPTGCYIMFEDTGIVSLNVFTQPLGYSSSLNELIEENICDAVQVCGTSLGPQHPRREGLNHLTQLLISDLTILRDDKSPKNKALCWIMTKDELYDDYKVCDGTLLQRYVMIYLYFFYDMNESFGALALRHTCGWPGVVCDSSQKFVTRLDFSNKMLNGSFTTVIGSLTRLQSINMNNNSLTGALPDVFDLFDNLEQFSVQKNHFVGEIPGSLTNLESMKKIDLSQNLFVGTLPTVFAEGIESFNVTNNLLQGAIHEISLFFSCTRVTHIDLSRNIFTGIIPDSILHFSNLRELRLDQNKISGTIPSVLGQLSKIETIQLQSNDLSGRIPTEIGLLQSAKVISLSYNGLKGTIPSELSNIRTLEFVHFHENELTGNAPDIEFENKFQESYITDCGLPAFSLPSRMFCTSCTMCCNSDDQCQSTQDSKRADWAAITIPIILSFLFWVLSMLERFGFKNKFFRPRNLENITEPNSVYSFIYSKNYTAWTIGIFTASIQFALFAMYLNAAHFTGANTDVIFTYICPSNDIKCADTRTASPMGWVLVIIVLAFYLGADIVLGMLQLKKAFSVKNHLMFISGFLTIFLTTLAIVTSLVYNRALAEKDTHLVMNTVILLFINDLDEQFFYFLECMEPAWLESRIVEVQSFLKTIDEKIEPREGSNRAENFASESMSTPEDSFRHVINELLQ